MRAYTDDDLPLVPNPLTRDQVKEILTFVHAKGFDRRRAQGQMNEPDYVAGAAAWLFALGCQDLLPAAWVFAPLTGRNIFREPPQDPDAWVHDTFRRDIAITHGQQLVEAYRHGGRLFVPTTALEGTPMKVRYPDGALQEVMPWAVAWFTNRLSLLLPALTVMNLDDDDDE